MKRRARLGKLEWVLIVASAFVVLLAIGVLSSPSGTTAGSPRAAPAVDTSTAYDGPYTELYDSGKGQKQTVQFLVTGDWDLDYTYDCQNLDPQGNSEGNFIIFIRESPGGKVAGYNPGVNVIGMWDYNGVTHEHQGGFYYLFVDTLCSWSVTVKDNLH